jgi:hypothetical protein
MHVAIKQKHNGEVTGAPRAIAQVESSWMYISSPSALPDWVDKTRHAEALQVGLLA